MKIKNETHQIQRLNIKLLWHDCCVYLKVKAITTKMH